MSSSLYRSSVSVLSTMCVLALPLGAQDEPSPMFRGNPAHTGVSSARLFSGQGGIKWRVKTGDAVRSTPAVTATRLFVGSGDGFLYALDRATGRTLWRFAAGSAVHSSPALAGGLVIAATMGGRIFAVDQAAGRIRWSVQTGDTLPRHVAPAGGWDLLVSSPVVSGNTVVIGGRDGLVYALDLSSERCTGGRAPAGKSARHQPSRVVWSWWARGMPGSMRSISPPGRSSGSTAPSVTPSTRRSGASTGRRSRARPPLRAARCSWAPATADSTASISRPASGSGVPRTAARGWWALPRRSRAA